MSSEPRVAPTPAAAPVKVLACHAYYQQPGGEDRSFEAEVALLESRGHEVVRFTRHNAELQELQPWTAARRTLWNGGVYRELRSLIRREAPAVMHCTNTFPLISPAAYYAARSEGVPVVQSLRNYRLLCANALLLRDDAVCRDCVGRLVAWPGVRHGCYRGDRAASAVVAALLGVHRALGTWARAVDLYVAPSEFARRTLVEGGIPADRIAVKPNFVDPDPGPGRGDSGGAVFVGRLSAEKGIATLLDAWPRLDGAMTLDIVGDGPLAGDVRRAAARDRRIRWRGRLGPAEGQRVVGEAAMLVMPSVCYETFGRAIVEAFASGTPVLASRLGAMTELVDHGTTGLLFEPGDAAGLAAALDGLRSRPAELARMRKAARGEYEMRYTAAANHTRLLELYARAMGRSRGPGGPSGAPPP